MLSFCYIVPGSQRNVCSTRPIRSLKFSKRCMFTLRFSGMRHRTVWYICHLGNYCLYLQDFLLFGKLVTTYQTTRSHVTEELSMNLPSYSFPFIIHKYHLNWCCMLNNSRYRGYYMYTTYFNVNKLCILSTECIYVFLMINSVALVSKRTISTERPPLVDEVSANFFADRGCRVVSTTDPHGRISVFWTRSRYFSVQVAPQLYSRGCVNPVPDPLLLRKSGSAGNRTRVHWICSQELWPLDHRETEIFYLNNVNWPDVVMSRLQSNTQPRWCLMN
jgi:hypothetical protein